ncbi:hypothetical protein [Amycolatopsis sp. NPDC051716]|uniref:DUF6959 family protein n=1 Tax=Amycolatopsis sp. NPDC051716 TaxID=3155804 RepID=UPI0034428468
MIEVELLGREGNVTVLRMPDRKFPGIFIQGDTMATFRDLFEEVGGIDELPEEIQEARDRVVEFLQYYEAVLRESGIARPY